MTGQVLAAPNETPMEDLVPLHATAPLLSTKYNE
eukprot:CAMPEP_0201282964 /NCGR_PEP_ID=MMETSP1317-20130820/7150_1 /ASSEMBLY_ACC=CAM_ASM_000770 /TAXON_ID=187299 /ORGANISM="Undescribed Undescribed, Strain Undescribed" /LENGTH=33 /DNA_ID= /DNA_START= /DNA_END= /DNA_ORIENTATION=